MQCFEMCRTLFGPLKRAMLILDCPINACNVIRVVDYILLTDYMSHGKKIDIFLMEYCGIYYELSINARHCFKFMCLIIFNQNNFPTILQQNLF